MSAESCQGAGTFGEGDGAGAHGWGDGASPLAVDFDGDSTLQQADGDDEAVNLVRVGDDAFQPGQGAALDVHLRSDAEKRPRLRGKARAKDGANGLDLFEVNGDGDLAAGEELDLRMGIEDSLDALLVVRNDGIERLNEPNVHLAQATPALDDGRVGGQGLGFFRQGQDSLNYLWATNVVAVIEAFEGAGLGLLKLLKGGPFEQ